MNKLLLPLSIGLALGAVEATAATLQPGDSLSIEAGSTFTLAPGITLPVPILGENGITVGSTPGDTGTGSHPGSPQPGDVGSVTQPWQFSGQTGYDYLSNTIGSGNFGGDTTTGVDMSTWTVTWNTISIPMGGCSLVAGGCTQNPGQTNEVIFSNSGIGAFNWSGIYGDSYTIIYTANVPVGDASNFGGVQYDLFLTGTVVPVPAAVWLFGSGILALAGFARRKQQG